MTTLTDDEINTVIEAIEDITDMATVPGKCETVNDIYSRDYKMCSKEFIHNCILNTNHFKEDLNKYIDQFYKNTELITHKYTTTLEEYCKISCDLMNKVKQGIKIEQDIIDEIKHLVNIKELHIKEDNFLMYNVLEHLINEPFDEELKDSYRGYDQWEYINFDYNKFISDPKGIIYYAKKTNKSHA